MATSNSTDWTATRDNIIERAYRIIGKLQPGDSASANEITVAAYALNEMVKRWQNRGVFLWTLEWVTKTFSASSQVTGTDSLNYTCIRSHTGATSDRPITGANWSTVWKQSGSSGVAWVESTAYSAIGDFAVAADTISIDKAFWRQSGPSDIPLEIITPSKYADISDKAATGTPAVLCFERVLTPRIYLWPQPNVTTEVLHVLRVRALEDFDATGNNPDFPVRWISALSWGLAIELSYENKIEPDHRGLIEQRAEMLFAEAKNADRPVSDSDFVESAYEV